MMTTAPKILFTQIGSLPYHNVDMALDNSFKTEIPFFPQIPIRNPWEYMIPQALEGLPGLEIDNQGNCFLDLNVWVGRQCSFAHSLDDAFKNSSKPFSFEAFEPSSSTASTWQPFLWELEERKIKLAKIQIAGPLTCIWTLRAKDRSPLDQHPELSSQIFKLILARATAMCRRLKFAGVTPIIFLDEPGLFALSPNQPSHVLRLQELKILIQALQKEGARVGLHCCSDPSWGMILGLGLSLISLDTHLSLNSILKYEEDLTRFLTHGGRLSLGVIPTSETLDRKQSYFMELADTLHSSFLNSKPELLQSVLSQSIYTPACGLALLSPERAQSIKAQLVEFAKEASARLF